MINKAVFKCSSEKISQVPKDSLPDIAFIGRSNVGKSSLINMLTQHKGLAKVSATPGKTRLINHFTINDSWYLVDLPGYGYARTSKSTRGGFAKADKLSKTQLQRSVTAYQKSLAEQWEELPPMFISSSEKGTGRDEIVGYIEDILKDFNKDSK